jgi:hypothetical protein
MAVIIDEMEGTIDPEPTRGEPEREDEGRAVSKEMSLDQIRSELSRLAQREMRLKAD